MDLSKYVAELDSISGGDPENDHANADGILVEALLDAGPDAAAVAKAYERLQARADGWWYS